MFHKRNISLLTTLAAIGGLIVPHAQAGKNSTALYWQQRAARRWHNPARKAAADQRQEQRQLRNLRHAQAGAYGRDWQAK